MRINSKTLINLFIGSLVAIALTGCGQDGLLGHLGKLQGTSTGNPMNPDTPSTNTPSPTGSQMMASHRILEAVCAVVMSAQPTVTGDNCVMGIMSTLGFGPELGLGESSGSMSFASIMEAEQSGMIAGDSSATDTCVYTIQTVPANPHTFSSFTVDSTNVNLTSYSQTPTLVQHAGGSGCKTVYSTAIPGTTRMPASTTPASAGSGAPSSTKTIAIFN